MPTENNSISQIFSRDQGTEWKYYEIQIEAGDLSSNDTFEVVIHYFK